MKPKDLTKESPMRQPAGGHRMRPEAARGWCGPSWEQLRRVASEHPRVKTPLCSVRQNTCGALARKDDFGPDIYQLLDMKCLQYPFRSVLFEKHFLSLCVAQATDIFDESVWLLSLCRNLVNFTECKDSCNTHHLYWYVGMSSHTIQVWGIVSVYLHSGFTRASA